jgi:hypothetical protein
MTLLKIMKSSILMTSSFSMNQEVQLNLLGMYEDIWSKGNFSKEWRSATVIPILNKRRKLPTNISDEVLQQGFRKDRK